MPCASRPGGGRLRVEHEQRGHVVAPVADRAGLADQRVPLQLVLDQGGRDVLAAGGDDQLLLPVGDLQEAVGVELADVAGVQPAVGVERLAGPLRVLVVAAHHQRAADQHLAVVGDPHLHAGERLADRAGAGVGRARRASRRWTARSSPSPRTSGTPSARKNSMISGSIGAAPLVAMPALVQSDPGEHRLPDLARAARGRRPATTSGSAAAQRRVQLLPDPRNADQRGRVDLRRRSRRAAARPGSRPA